MRLELRKTINCDALIIHLNPVRYVQFGVWHSRGGIVDNMRIYMEPVSLKPHFYHGKHSTVFRVLRLSVSIHKEKIPKGQFAE